MANFAAADVKRLRDATGAGMMACKTALEQSDGDVDKAVEVLRLKGAKDVGKREGRTAANGLVTAILDGTSRGVLLELACETDFVAKTPAFQELAADVAGTVARTHPTDVEALLETAGSVDATTTVRQQLGEANAAMGEKIEVRRFADFAGGYVATYLHKSSPDLPPTVGVLVQLDAENEQVAKDVAQQVAAMSPRYVTREQVPEQTVATERRIAEQMAREEGKPEQAITKIVEGRVGSYFKDFVLVEQASVKENKVTIQALLDRAGVRVQRFARFKVGQP